MGGAMGGGGYGGGMGGGGVGANGMAGGGMGADRRRRWSRRDSLNRKNRLIYAFRMSNGWRVLWGTPGCFGLRC